MTKCILAASVVVLGLAGIAVGLGADGGASSALTSDPATILRTMPVGTVSIRPTDSFLQRRKYTGMIRARRTTDLSFQRPGKLVRMLVDEGDRVIAGQPLAELDMRHLEARRGELSAQRAEAKARLDELEAGPRTETIEAARARVRELTAQLELQQINHRRRQRLQQRDVISQEEFDQSAFGVDAAQARLDAAQQSLSELEAGTRREQIEAQRAVVARIDAALADLAVEFDDATVVASFAGRITQRYADEGRIVSPATPIVRVVEDRRLEAWFGLPPRAAAGLAVGDAHHILVDKVPYTATITALVAELDPATRTRTVILTLDNAAADHVVTGQTARLEVADKVHTDGYWLPTAALARGHRGLWSVLVVSAGNRPRQGITERREVEVLHTEGDRVLVRGTLEPGDRVINGGTHRVVPGQLVTMVADQ